MTGNQNNVYSFWTKLMRVLTWKIIVIYVSISIIAYNLIKDLVEPLSLPIWTLPFIVVFFIACFPVVMLFSVLIDKSRIDKRNKDFNSESKEDKLTNLTVERKFRIIDIFLLVTVIAFILFFIFYEII